MTELWDRYQEYLYSDEELGLMLDISRMRFPDDFFPRIGQRVIAAMRAMQALEAGSIANPDEKRRVGHYWLRAPELAPDPELTHEIERTLEAVRAFAAQIHSGEVAPEQGGKFKNMLLIGVGGSALGPQFIADALGYAGQPMRPYFLDNTDPNGMERVYAEIGEGLSETLTLVISKSGGTKETHNGMIETKAAYERKGLTFARHAVAVTKDGSELDAVCKSEGWLRQFPMWDWVGGRTSVFSAVGMLPAALLGFRIEELLAGARAMDARTRSTVTRSNPALLLALMWLHAGQEHGLKDMVVLPYKDRLQLFPRYLQQLVMESLGKEYDLQGREADQGIVVYGNKGSTDQHAYVQQLRGGQNNFFVTFIEVLQDGDTDPIDLEPGVTSGDYLSGFLLGTRQALADRERESLTITLHQLDAAGVGKLIALYDRAVGLYANFVGINAYDQPGVEAGKEAADRVIEVQKKITAALQASGDWRTAEAQLGCLKVRFLAAPVFRHIGLADDR
ncbi:MAG: glucose-6-phosphate isomerase, partial [Actinomycetota bacterium]